MDTSVIQRRRQNNDMAKHDNVLSGINDKTDLKVNEETNRFSYINVLTRPTKSSRLVVFRVLFGSCMTWEIVRTINKGIIDANFKENFPEINFHYYFAWNIETPPRPVVDMLFYICAASAVLLALGLFYRISSFVFFISYSYINMLEKAQYNNHYYFYILLAFIFLMTDCHKSFALDSIIKSYVKKGPNEEKFVPNWQICLFRFQVIVCYFYSAIAKMNKDWFLRGEPCQTFFCRIPAFLSLAKYIVGDDNAAEFLGYTFCYVGFLFDFLIGFILLSTTFRPLGFLITAIFHLTNHFAFSIGTFPWTMLTTNILFIDEDTLGAMEHRVRITFEALLLLCRPASLKNEPTLDQKIIKDENIYRKLGMGDQNYDKTSLINAPRKEKTKKELKTMHKVTKLKVAVLVCYVLLQIVVPFRHWLYPGDVNFTMEGDLFSWRMKLNSKDYLLRILVKPGKDMAEFVHEDYKLTRRQMKRMLRDPEMILQYTQHLSEKYQQGEDLASVCVQQGEDCVPQGEDQPSVRVDMWQSLNKRPYQQWIDPAVNLATEPHASFSYSWLQEQISDEYFSFTQLHEIRDYWRRRHKTVTFFIQKSGQISKTFLKFDYCSSVTLLAVTGDMHVEMEKLDYNVSVGTTMPLPSGKSHSVQTLTTVPTVWAYVHGCRKAIFHHAITMTSGDSFKIKIK